MYYFIDNNYTVTTREHQFNAEYLDGRLQLIEETDPCYIVKHIPNNTWTYDLNRLAIVSAGYGDSKVSTLNANIVQASPPTYHSLIPVDSFWDYISRNNYEDKTENIEILNADSTVSIPTPSTTITVETPVASVIPTANSTTETTTTTTTTTSTPAQDIADVTTMVPIPIIVDIPNPTTSNTVQLSVSTDGMFDALNGGHYPAVQALENDPVYKFKSPGIKNT